MNKCGDAFVNDLCHRIILIIFNSLRRKSNAGKIIAGNAWDI